MVSRGISHLSAFHPLSLRHCWRPAGGVWGAQSFCFPRPPISNSDPWLEAPPTRNAGDSLAHLFGNPAALCFGGDAVYTARPGRHHGERNESSGCSDRINQLLSVLDSISVATIDGTTWSGSQSPLGPGSQHDIQFSQPRCHVQGFLVCPSPTAHTRPEHSKARTSALNTGRK